MFKDAHAPFVF